MATSLLRLPFSRLSTPPPGTTFSSLQRRVLCKSLSKVNSLQWRLLTSTVRQLGIKNAKPAVRQLTPKSQSVTRPLQASKKNRASYESFSESLARRPSPTILYEAPSPYLYITGCYALATACFVYAGFNFESTYLHPPEQIGYWIPIAVGGVCVAMAFFGVWSIFGAYRIVRTITALPRPTSAMQQPLLLRIDNAAMLPGIRPKSVVAPQYDVVLSDHAFTPPIKLSPAELIAARREEEQRREFERSRILTLPFRQASYWMWRGFTGFKNIIWKDDFIYMQIVGRNGTFKLDRNAAWALDDGRALDRVVKHRLSDT